ncbi:SLATT domain-containing protein [Tahibacter caeni]|uniref:SLATT domain-containing protein n=1 Tax=Tahibacter caeni TaxID=1453545 RepID=UPI0021481B2C|nr:DUF4231 domain-containing protein [Tahibacter caeni]
MSNGEHGSVYSRSAAIVDREIGVSIAWYRRKQVWPMIFYRSCGILTILLGLLIPLIASSQIGSKDRLLVVLGFLIAFSNGLSSFLGSERLWRGRTLAAEALEHVKARWEIEVIRAQDVLQAVDRDRHILQATAEALDRCREITSVEAEAFFAALKPLSSTGSSGGDKDDSA